MLGENFKESLDFGRTRLIEIGILFLITDATAQYWRGCRIPNGIFLIECSVEIFPA